MSEQISNIEYLNQFGSKCLYCQAINFERYRPVGVQLATDDIPQVEVYCHCHDCDKKWTEIYELKEVFNV